MKNLIHYTGIDGIKKIYQDTIDRKILILVPGFGKQSGKVQDFLAAIKSSGLDPRQCMLNVGTSLMKSESGDVKTETKKFAEEIGKFL